MGLATLLQRRKNGRYYFRQVVPKDLRESFGQREFVKSLRTSDAKEAKSRAKEVALEYDRLIQKTQQQISQSSVTSPGDDLSATKEKIAAAYQKLLDDDEKQWLSRERSEGLYDQYSDILRDFRAELVDYEDEEGYIGPLGRVVIENISEMAGLELTRPVRHWILRLGIPILERLCDRAQGIWQEDTTDNLSPNKNHVLSRTATTASTSQAPTLTQCFEGWKAERNPTEKTADEYARFVKRFNEVAGGDLSVNEITSEHVRNYKDALINAPSRPPNKLRRLPFPMMIKKADPNLPKLRPRAVMKAFKAVKTILNWAVDNDYLEQSPGVKYTPSDIDAKERKKYSPEEIQAILDATKDEKGSMFWLPRLGLYTGARLQELAQSETGDIHYNKEQDFYYLDIHKDGEGRRLKTKGSVRKVPLHPDLIALGFIDYINQRKKSGGPLWYDLGRLDEYGSPATFSKKFNKMVKDLIEVDTEHEMKDFHSFRHTFKHICRACSIPEDIHDILTGHSSGTVSRTYGGEYPMKPLWEAVKSLKFPLA